MGVLMEPRGALGALTRQGRPAPEPAGPHGHGDSGRATQARGRGPAAGRLREEPCGPCSGRDAPRPPQAAAFPSPAQESARAHVTFSSGHGAAQDLHLPVTSPTVVCLPLYTYTRPSSPPSSPEVTSVIRSGAATRISSADATNENGVGAQPPTRLVSAPPKSSTLFPPSTAKAPVPHLAFVSSKCVWLSC